MYIFHQSDSETYSAEAIVRTTSLTFPSNALRKKSAGNMGSTRKCCSDFEFYNYYVKFRWYDNRGSFVRDIACR